MSHVISVSQVAKVYRLYSDVRDRMIELLDPFKRPRHQEFHALNDINFDVLKGECVGIIGPNGAGKSTLLKMLAGVLTPTSGSVNVTGRVASLLELGAGFNPELSGRENIFFQGALLGIPKSEMAKNVEKIINFADIGEFIDQPVRVYSSGMFVRLAFSVMIHSQPEILIVDEALAVGDVRFQKKCVDFMRNFRDAGNTILFVSHDIYTVKAFCSRVILINKGRVEMDGAPEIVANHYHQLMFPTQHDITKQILPDNPKDELINVDNSVHTLHADLSDTDLMWGSGSATIDHIMINGVRKPNLISWDNPLLIQLQISWNYDEVLEIILREQVESKLLVGCRLENSSGIVITNFTNSVLPNVAFDISKVPACQCSAQIEVDPIRLPSGHYFMSPGIAIGTKEHLFPVVEYTNAIHLFCDTDETVLGLARFDYDIKFT